MFSLSKPPAKLETVKKEETSDQKEKRKERLKGRVSLVSKLSCYLIPFLSLFVCFPSFVSVPFSRFLRQQGPLQYVSLRDHSNILCGGDWGSISNPSHSPLNLLVFMISKFLHAPTHFGMGWIWNHPGRLYWNKFLFRKHLLNNWKMHELGRI